MIGRALGVGVRVFGRIAGQCLAPPAPSPAALSQPGPSASGPSPVRSVRRGLGSFLRPFCRVGGILWLEVTGVFFLLPVIVFAPYLWRAIAAYPHSADHKTLWVTAVMIAVFLYLGVSSFWRANRRSRQR